MNAVCENGLYPRMGENDLSGGFLNVTTSQAVYRFGVVVGDLVDVRVAAPATDASMRTPIEKSFIHVEEPVGAFLVDAGQTSEAMAHQAILGVQRVQSL
jgi:hypothetical protein